MGFLKDDFGNYIYNKEKIFNNNNENYNNNINNILIIKKKIYIKSNK